MHSKGAVDLPDQERPPLANGGGGQLPGVIDERRMSAILCQGDSHTNWITTGQTNSLQQSRADAAPHDDKTDPFWRQWHETRGGFLQDVERHLRRQDELVAIFMAERDRNGLRRTNAEETASPHLQTSIPLCVDSASSLERPWSAKQRPAPPPKQAEVDFPSPPVQPPTPLSARSADWSAEPVRAVEEVERARFVSRGSAIDCRAHTKYDAWLAEHNDEVEHVLSKADREGGFLADRIERIMTCLGTYEEPKREGQLARLIEMSWFHALVTLMIILDSAFTAYSVDYGMHHFGSGPTAVMNVMEAVFVAFYFLECSARVFVHRKFFFVGSAMAWNVFDFLLTLQGSVDIILSYSLGSNGGAHLRFMRLVRLLKLGKLLRLVRAIKFFRDLRAMAQAIVHSVSSMFWAFVMLALILYVYALFFVQMMHGYVSDNIDALDFETRTLIMRYFGSVGSGVLTLYQSASSGVDWKEVYVVVELSGVLSSLGFIFFIWFFNFAVVNILSGIFIEKALDAAIPDRDQLALEQRRGDEAVVAHLTDLITAMDTNGNGMVTLKDFLVQCHDRCASAYLRTLGIDTNDASMLFNLLQRVVGTGELPIEDFVGMLVKIKGNAKALDLQNMAFEVSVVRRTLNELACLIAPDVDLNITRNSTRTSIRKRTVGGRVET